MVAILNASKEEIETILAENGLTNIDLANYNTPSQIVISGPVDEIGRAEPFFQKGEMLYYPLNTSGAFHSRFMQPSREKFEAYLKKFKLSNLKIPVVANVTAKPYHDEEVMTVLSSQISSTVRWCESIQYLLTLDSASNPMEFVEMGSGDVLTKMVDRIKTDTPKSSTGSSVNKNQDNAQAVKTETGSSGSDKILPKAVNELNKNFVKAEEKVSAWNKKYPVGTKVKSSVADYGDLETRTEAIVLFGHRAAVYMKEYNGYFDLEEVTPA
jgi:acyl transferase domain-containing protein